MAAQAGLQIPAASFEGQAEKKEQLKTQGQIAVKKVDSPQTEQMVHHVAAPIATHPDIAHAQAQIMAQHEALRSQVAGSVNG